MILSSLRNTLKSIFYRTKYWEPFDYFGYNGIIPEIFCIANENLVSNSAITIPIITWAFFTIVKSNDVVFTIHPAIITTVRFNTFIHHVLVKYIAIIVKVGDCIAHPQKVLT